MFKFQVLIKINEYGKLVIFICDDVTENCNMFV
jgi:hypothetical protein